MRFTQRVIALLAAGAMTLGISATVALAQDSSKAVPAAKIRYTLAMTGEPTTLNPLRVYQAVEYYPLEWTYLLPFGFSQKDLGNVPDFATKVETSPDGMTFTYTVRDDVKWSDGQPMTAADMAYTLQLYKESHAYIFGGYLKDMASVEATDATHVVLHSKRPTSLYAGNYLYTFLLPQHIWDNLPQGMRPKQFENVPAVGSGPYTIAEYKTGQYVRLEKNPEWNGPQPAIDEIIVQYYKSEDAMAEALKGGEIDFAYFTSANIFNSVKDAPNVGTMVGAVPSFDEIGMNTGSSYEPKTASYTPHGDGHPALTDVKVRQAIRMAISSKELSDKVFLGYAQPGDTIVPPISVAGMRWAPTGDQVLSWSIDAANKLLDDAGYKDCNNDGIREMPGCKQPSLEFRYYIRTSDQTTVDAAPFVQKWLEQIGIKANVEAMSSGRLGDIINAGEYDLFDWGWYPDPDPDSQLSYFTCDQRPPDGKSYGNNDPYFCNAQYDKMYQEQHTELDPQKRIEIIHQMQQLFYEQSPYAVKWYSPLLQGYRTDTFTGYVPQPQPQGDLLNGYTYKGMLSIRPIGAGGTGSNTKGISPAVWLGIILGLIIVIAGIVLARRSRSSDEDVA